MPRGVALVIGCNTFPTWNSYPGLFASLVTGNAVVVKPHPRAVLPLAITVQIAREVLAETGFSPDLVSLAAEQPGEGLAKVLALRAEVRIIDYTGSTEFGTWLERNAPQASVFTEKAGVNTVVIDSTDDYQGMLANLAFSLSLYSGQMCTTPQNLLVPRDGITADGEPTVGRRLRARPRRRGRRAARRRRAGDGAAGRHRQRRCHRTARHGSDVRRRRAARPARSSTPSSPTQRCARPPSYASTSPTATPTCRSASARCRSSSRPTAPRSPSTCCATRCASTVRSRRRSTPPTRRCSRPPRQAALDSGVALSCNLTETVYVNQSAAFSDFHATGANPAANAALTDAAYVASRFRIVQSRRHLPAVAG